MRSRGNAGFTLLEATLASFLLLTAVLLAVYLFDSTLRARAVNERRLAAVMAAENVLEDIQARARTDFGTLVSTLDGAEWPVPDPTVKVVTHVRKTEIVVPSTQLESPYPHPASLPQLGKKIMQDSMLKVELEARWSERPRDHVVVVGFVADPRPNQFELRIVSVDGTEAAPDQELLFRAVAIDANGERIDDLILTWYVEPLVSWGSVARVRRDGWECVYKNTYEDYNGRLTSTPGTCRLVVRGVYRGREVTHAVDLENR